MANVPNALANGQNHAPRVPSPQQLLTTEPLSLTDLLIVCGLSTIGYAAVRLDRVLYRDGHLSGTVPGKTRM